MKSVHENVISKKPLSIYRFSDSGAMHAVDVVDNEMDEEFVTQGVRTYVTDVMIGLKERFPNEVGSVLASLDVFHLESLPDTREKWVEYFDESIPDIRRLVELFLVIVLSSVHCKPYLSQMNLTKTLQ